MLPFKTLTAANEASYFTSSNMVAASSYSCLILLQEVQAAKIPDKILELNTNKNSGRRKETKPHLEYTKIQAHHPHR